MNYKNFLTKKLSIMSIKYKAIQISQLPNEMVEEIEKFIAEHPEYGFTSIAEFIRYSVRTYIEFRRELSEKRGSEGEYPQ